MLKPFSENISTGTISTGIISIESVDSVDSYAGSISIQHLQRGKDLDEKVKIFFNRAGIVSGPRKEWIEDKLDNLWSDYEQSKLQNHDSPGYNKALLNFLDFQDKEYLLSKTLDTDQPIPKNLLQHLKKQKADLAAKRVKPRRGSGIALSAKEQEKIYATPGLVPTWWWPDPKKGTYTYHAMKAIKKLGVSARDVEKTLRKAADRKSLSVDEIRMLQEGWGLVESGKILKGEYPITERMFRLYQADMNYHRDVGWY
jgi:hypothetical protein